MVDIDALVGALRLEEKAALTAGEDMMSTVAVERLGIPKVQVTDGPNGARGAELPGDRRTALGLHSLRHGHRRDLGPGAWPRRWVPSSAGKRSTAGVEDCWRRR